VGIGWIIRQSVPSYRKLSSANFIIDLPQYQFPQLFNMVKYVADKLKDFIFQAGKIIGLTLIAMWLLQSTPLPGSGASFGEVEDVHDSVYGAITDSIAVAFKPTGFGDWHFSSAIITGFIAKEVVVSSIAQSYNLDDPLEDEDPVTTAKLGDEIRTTLENDAQGNVPVYVGGFALMFFFLAYTPCFATVAECKRVFGGWFAVKSVILSVAVGYLGALLIFQIGSLFF
jgi:ferrous iron transport protein B